MMSWRKTSMFCIVLQSCGLLSSIFHLFVVICLCLFVLLRVLVSRWFVLFKLHSPLSFSKLFCEFFGVQMLLCVVVVY